MKGTMLKEAGRHTPAASLSQSSLDLSRFIVAAIEPKQDFKKQNKTHIVCSYGSKAQLVRQIQVARRIKPNAVYYIF